MAIQLGNGVANRIRDVDGGGALVDDGLDHAGQKVDLAAVTVFGAEFDVGAQVAGKAHGLFGLLQHLLGRHAQLFLHVQWRCGNEGMNTATVRTFQGLSRTRNVTVVGTRQ